MNSKTFFTGASALVLALTLACGGGGSGSSSTSGGGNGGGGGATTLPYDSFVASGSLVTPRSWTASVLLPNGNVLVTGGMGTGNSALASCELYDPTTGQCTTTGSMTIPRMGHTASLLQDGTVLIAGGTGDQTTNLPSAEIYNPATGTFTPTTGPMVIPRWDHLAVTLSDGTVLIAGGENSGNDYNPATGTSAEIYSPTTGTFSTLPAMTNNYGEGTATTLANGTILFAGGANPTSSTIYTPSTKTFSTTANLNVPRAGAIATLLPSGNVLVAGGITAGSPSNPGGTVVATAEIYNSATGTFKAAGSLNLARSQAQAVLLPTGNVFICGGYTDTNSNTTATAETFDPETGTFTKVTAPMPAAAAAFYMGLLPSKKVILIGGTSGGSTLTPLGTTTFFQ